MVISGFFTLVSALLPTLITASGPTSIFINQISEYSSLSSCAEVPVSTIVRDMQNGCGDGSHTTSYACFCYESSSKFSSMISAHVSKACTDSPGQETLAGEVFSEYCQLGVLDVKAPGATSSSSPSTSASTERTASASPASTPTTILADPTSTDVSPDASSSTGTSAAITTATSSAASPATTLESKKPNTIAIACGVAFPIGLLAVAAGGFFVWRQRKKALERPDKLTATEQTEQTFTEDIKVGSNVYELKDGCSSPPVELDSGGSRAGQWR